jgi:hypothetical protein
MDYVDIILTMLDTAKKHNKQQNITNSVGE